MGHWRNAVTIGGLAVLGLGAFAAVRGIPYMIQTYQATTTVAPTTTSIGSAKSVPAPRPSGASNPATSETVSSVSSSSANSYNWAGMVQTGLNEQSVRATWTAPHFTSAATSSRDSLAEWVGLGGMNANTLIQVGTITTPSSQGQPVTSVFWEMLPKSAVQSATIPTGSTVTAKIEPTGVTNQWRLMLTVKGQTSPLIDKVLTLTAAEAQQVESSADWITEAPTTGHGVAPLAPVASTVMTHVAANGVPLSRMNSSTLQSVALYSHSGQLLADPTTIQHNALTVQTAYSNALPASGSNSNPWMNAPGTSGYLPGSSNGFDGGYSGGGSSDWYWVVGRGGWSESGGWSSTSTTSWGGDGGAWGSGYGGY